MSDLDDVTPAGDVPASKPETDRGTIATEPSHEVGLTERLGRLSASLNSEDEEYIPGEGDSLPPPLQPHSLDPAELALLLEETAQEESSAMAKARGLSVAGLLYQHTGNKMKSTEVTQEAVDSAPKLALASLYLRKSGFADLETMLRTLESSTRLAAHESSRAHAASVYFRNQISTGDQENAAKVLDQTVRNGDGGIGLALRRIINRVSLGKSLAGVELPAPFSTVLSEAHEAVFGALLKSDGTRVSPASEAKKDLALARSVRALRQGDLESTILALRSSEANPETVDELQAAFATVRGDKQHAISILKALAAKNPETRLLRELAALSLELGDKETLASVLENADPGEGTFELPERVLLETYAGRGVSMNHDDYLVLAETDPDLALALSPIDTPALDPTTAPLSRLLIQLGAGLRTISERKESDALREALAELEKREETGQLSTFFLALSAHQRRSAVELARNLLTLTAETNDAIPTLLCATVLEAHEEKALAMSAYRSAFDQKGVHQAAAARGVISTSGADDDTASPSGAQLLASAEEHFTAPAVRFAAELRRALEHEGTELTSATHDACLRILGSSTETTSVEERKERVHLAWVSASFSAQRGNDSMASEARDVVAQTATALGHLAKVRNVLFHSTDIEENAKPEDISERALFYSRSFLEKQLGEATSAAEQLLNAALAFSTGALGESAAALHEISDLSPEISSAQEDLLELSGATVSLGPRWVSLAKETQDPESRRYAYERLAELDSLRGEHSSSALWRRTLAEEFPDHLPSLVRQEEVFLTEGAPSRFTDAGLANALPPSDKESYSLVSGALSLAKSDFRSARQTLEPLLDEENPSLLALRGLATVAREKRDDDLLFRCYERLAKSAATDLDGSATALECAFILCRLGRNKDAIGWAKLALARKPGSFSAALLLHHLAESKDLVARAEQLEEFAESVATTSLRKELWFACGLSWMEAKDPGRASRSFEETLKASPSHRDAFVHLSAIREAEERWDAVCDLLSARLELIPEAGTEHLELELKLAELLALAEKPKEAKEHLERALAAHPENPQALRAHADVSARLGAHESAEESLVALRDRLADGDEKTAVIRSLARIYDQHLGQLERAMDAYQDVLRNIPDEESSSEALISVYCRLGLAERATSLQTELIQRANTAEKKRNGALKLAELYENVAKDPKRAGATLERTRKAWPLDADALEATILFMDRQGNTGSRGFLLDRAGKDAIRKLESERLDGALLDTLSRVAKLSGHSAEAEAAASARAAYLGLDEPPLRGAGVHALGPKVDEIIAPRGFATPLRLLLQKTGPAMDAAFSVDLTQMGAQPLTSGVTFDRLTQIGEALKWPQPELFVSDNLGAKCLPVTNHPPRFLVGRKVDELRNNERDYLLLRSFKLQSLGAGALARSRDDDRWPMLVALLHLFAPNWRPASVDGRKAAKAKAHIEQGLARVGYDDDVPTLALEAIGAIGGNPEGLGEAPRVLANRGALLAVGDISAVLSVIAAGDGVRLAESGPSRFRWIENHAEAKDLLLFATGQKNALAREGLGLAEKPVPMGAQQSTSTDPTRGEPVAPGRPVQSRSDAGAPPRPRRPKPPTPPRGKS